LLTTSKPSTSCSKKERKGDKGKAKKPTISKVEKHKDIGHFLLQKLSKF